MGRKEEIIKGITCEQCGEERVFGNPPDDTPENKYIYSDLSGATRCFCKKHMHYGKNKSGALLNYDDDWDYPLYGAKLISEIIK